MKLTILILSIFSLFSIEGNKGNEGIKFTESSFESAIQLAQKENKLIFLDAYTTWCGPCRMMSNNVFTDNSIGTLFNQNFINIKVDMDTEEGKKIADKYFVTAYPTLIFIGGSGKQISKIVGYKNSEELLDIGKHMVKKSNKK